MLAIANMPSYPAMNVAPTSPLHPQYRVVPLKDGFLDRVRHSGLDDQQQAVERSVAIGGEPCRDVLRRALPGEDIILASYCPFELAGPYKEYGPIFVLATHREAPCALHALPIGDGNAYFKRPFVLRAYSRAERIVDE
jgi:hypothetical protein